MGYDLVAVEWLPSGRSVLRLSIDAPQGVGIDDIVRVSHRVSLLLDEADPIPSAYSLEVSSPGIDRPVERAVDFARFTGKRVKIVLEEGLPRRRYTGAIAGVDGDDVRVEVDGVEHLLSIAQIERAHLVLTLEEYAELAPQRAGAEKKFGARRGGAAGRPAPGTLNLPAGAAAPADAGVEDDDDHE